MRGLISRQQAASLSPLNDTGCFRGKGQKMNNLGSGPIELLALEGIGWFNGGIEEVLLLSEVWMLSEAQMRRDLTPW